MQWNEHELIAGNGLLIAFERIGAVHWPGADSELRIPCRVQVHGDWHDPALVQLQNRPLLLWAEPAPPVFLIDEVDDLTPSEFALSHELRMQGINTPEKAMGYAPHAAYWGTEPVRLNGLVEVWGESGRMGMDLTSVPAREPWSARAQNPRELSAQRLVYVVGDVTEEVRRRLR
jgi:hypothetical protein